MAERQQKLRKNVQGWVISWSVSWCIRRERHSKSPENVAQNELFELSEIEMRLKDVMKSCRTETKPKTFYFSKP